MEYNNIGNNFVIDLSYIILSKINIISLYIYLHGIMDKRYI